MLITPVLIALVFAVIQTALVWNARHTVTSAAQHGARLARTATALSPSLADAASTGFATSDEQIRASTLTFLRSTGGGSLTNTTVTIRHDGNYVAIVVSGSTVGVLPGTTVRVSGHSRTPIEGFRPDIRALMHSDLSGALIGTEP